MKLAEALKHVFEDGQKIRRTGWPIIIFVSINDGTLRIFQPDGEYHDWLITAADIVSTDWIIL
jgi:hypothetical protein